MGLHKIDQVWITYRPFPFSLVRGDTGLTLAERGLEASTLLLIPEVTWAHVETIAPGLFLAHHSIDMVQITKSGIQWGHMGSVV